MAFLRHTGEEACSPSSFRGETLQFSLDSGKKAGSLNDVPTGYFFHCVIILELLFVPFVSGGYARSTWSLF